MSGTRRRALAAAADVEAAATVTLSFDSLETLMARSGFYSTDEIRPANEGRFDARAKLGRLLAKIEKAGHDRKSASRPGNLKAKALADIGLDKNRASEAEHIGGGRGGKLTVSRAGMSYRSYIASLGLDKNMAKLARKEAALSDEQFEASIAKIRRMAAAIAEGIP